MHIFRVESWIRRIFSVKISQNGKFKVKNCFDYAVYSYGKFISYSQNLSAYRQIYILFIGGLGVVLVKDLDFRQVSGKCPTSRVSKQLVVCRDLQVFGSLLVCPRIHRPFLVSTIRNSIDIRHLYHIDIICIMACCFGTVCS